MASLQNGRDKYGTDIGLRPPSDYINQLSLAANISERFALPAGYSRVIISGTANHSVLFGNSSVAATNTTDKTDGSASELNPGGYILDGITATHIAVISDAVAIVTFAFYTL